MLRAVKTCLIHNTLQSAPAIEVVVNTAAPQKAPLAAA